MADKDDVLRGLNMWLAQHPSDKRFTLTRPQVLALVAAHPSNPPPAIEAVIAEMRERAEKQGVEAGAWLRHYADRLASLRPHPSPPPDRQAVFLGICGFTRHRAGCPQLSGPVNCTCGLGEAQEALIAALQPVTPPPDAPIAALIADWRKESARLVEEANTAIWPSDAGRMSLRQKARTLTECADAADALAASPRPSPAGTTCDGTFADGVDCERERGHEGACGFDTLRAFGSKSSPAGTREEKGREG